MSTKPADLRHLLTVVQVARELELSQERVRQIYHSGDLRVAAWTPYGALFAVEDIEAEKQRRAENKKAKA